MFFGSHKKFIKGFLFFELNEDTKLESFKYNHGGIDIEMDGRTWWNNFYLFLGKTN